MTSKPTDATYCDFQADPIPTKEPIFPPYHAGSDDLDAIQIQHQDTLNGKTGYGLDLHCTAPELNYGARDIGTSTSKSGSPNKESAERPLDIALPDMTFSSSPVLYPASSSPPQVSKKRKLFQSLKPLQHKKPKLIGGFVDDVEEQVAVEGRDKDRGFPELLEFPTHVALDSVVDNIGLETAYSDPKEGRCPSPTLPPIRSLLTKKKPSKTVMIRSSSGKTSNVAFRTKSDTISYEQAIAQRSITPAGRAKKSYYGVDVHELIDNAKHQAEIDRAQAESKEMQAPVESIEKPVSRASHPGKASFTQMWTEKYRARKFTELVGDERTHRSVLRWLKGWDSIVFPGSTKAAPKRIFEDRDTSAVERQHRKILLLTGPPGLGKTTLAHVCARQAGYEVLEINASDDRSRDVVKGRIKDALGTENVRGIMGADGVRSAGRPICVVVDEADGVVSGSGAGGEGGFIKALIDLVQLDQRSSSTEHRSSAADGSKRKGDRFRQLRPLVLICNDVYAPALRPLRNSSFAEIVHVKKPPLDKVVARLKNVFEKENIPCDSDAVRRLCEVSWGLGTRKQNSVGNRGAGEGDIRGVLVQGEWIAHKLRATSVTGNAPRLTRKWIECHLESSRAASGQSGLGRGGVREVVERVFLEGAGLPNLPTAISVEEARLIAESNAIPVGVSDLRKRSAIIALREMIDTCGDHDRLMSDCFATYPTLTFQDDVSLSKPNAGYDWLHFHDALSSRVYGGQEWELSPYLSTGACGFHHLFAAVDKGEKGWSDEKPIGNGDEVQAEGHPFSGLKADFAAYEAEKRNRAVVNEFQSHFSAPLLRIFRSTEVIASELIPNVGRMLAPEVKPIVVGGSGGSASVASVRKASEKNCVKIAVRVMSGFNVAFEKVRIEVEGAEAHRANAGFVYRMEPPLDTLTTFHMQSSSSKSVSAPAAPVPVRYAIRQVLDQELRKAKILQNSAARHARSTLLHNDYGDEEEDKENASPAARTTNKLTQNLGRAPSHASTVGFSAVKRDFFGRVIVNDATRSASSGEDAATGAPRKAATENDGGGGGGGGGDAAATSRVWISFHDGYSNAVRKPITLKELMGTF